MGYIRRHVVAVVLLLSLAACGPAVVAEAGPQCLKLSEPSGSTGLITSGAAKISLFFSVDTCEGAPVAGLDATRFDIFEDGKAVSAYESQRTIQPKGQAYRLSSLLLLDLSGSMLRSDGFPALLDAARRYTHTVLQAAGDGQRLAVMTFDGREAPTLLVDFTGDEAAVLAGLASLEVQECTTNQDCAGTADRKTCAGWRCVDDSTNLNGAVVHALDALDARAAADATIAWKDSALIAFTDGSDEAARVSSADAVARARSSASHVFTVGLGEEIDSAALQALGKDGAWTAAQSAQLGQAFDAVAARVTGLANRFYLLEYCSPKRGGTHTLKVTASVPQPQGPPLVGGLSRDFDASGFVSGCQL